MRHPRRTPRRSAVRPTPQTRRHFASERTGVCVEVHGLRWTDGGGARSDHQNVTRPAVIRPGVNVPEAGSSSDKSKSVVVAAAPITTATPVQNHQREVIGAAADVGGGGASPMGGLPPVT